MAWDPYAPPKAAPDPAPIATTRLFGPVTIALVTALLNPVFGVFLAAVNHHRLRDAAGVRRTLLLFGIPSAGVVVLQVLGPAKLHVLWLLFSIAMATTLYREHAPLVARHVAAGGLKARGYLIFLGCVVLFAIGLAVWQFLSP
jgi:hypothetical protein